LRPKRISIGALEWELTTDFLRWYSDLRVEQIRSSRLDEYIKGPFCSVYKRDVRHRQAAYSTACLCGAKLWEGEEIQYDFMQDEERVLDHLTRTVFKEAQAMLRRGTLWAW